MRKARVFISCGQRDDREVSIGTAVQNYFKSNGFETYFAEKVHSSEGLTENIFRFLRQSEYFVFIDFKRDKITEKDWRGSLFVNQELAIATFLNIDGIGFLEEGIKREGILEYQIYNPKFFKDGSEIINQLKELTKKWDNNSVNELEILYDSSLTSRNIPISNHPDKPFSDWYHLEILNRNKMKHAFSCMGYVTQIQDLTSSKKYHAATNEIIWSGIGDISANIMGGTVRSLDAFCIIHKQGEIVFHQRPLGTTVSRYRLPNLPKGKYLIEFTIISLNFEKVSKMFLLDFQEGYEKLEFKEA